MSVSGAVVRAVSASGVTAVPAAALAEVGVGRAQNLDPNQPEERLGAASSGFRADPFIRDWTPAQPEALNSSNSTTPPSLCDGLMATPSAGAHSMDRPFPHSRAVSDSSLADFNRQVSEQHATIFDWSDRLRTCRIPTSGKVLSIAEFHGMRRMGREEGTQTGPGIVEI
jgi:hypothetical protein